MNTFMLKVKNVSTEYEEGPKTTKKKQHKLLSFSARYILLTLPAATVYGGGLELDFLKSGNVPETQRSRSPLQFNLTGVGVWVIDYR